MPPSVSARPKPAEQPARLDTVLGPLVEGDMVAGMGRDIERLNASFVETADVTIGDARAYVAAGHFLKEVQDRKKRVAEFFAPMKLLAHRLHKVICTRENAMLAPLEQIDRTVRDTMIAYANEQERIRRQEEARLQEEERQREEQRLLEEAAHLERQGHHELAESVVEHATTMPAPVVTVVSQTPKVSGVAIGSNWTWRPVNGDRARAQQLVPREYMALDEKKLNQFAKMHGASARLPGIEFYDAGKVTVRG